MTLCNGVLGRQVLRKDRAGLEASLAPPSLFTDGRTLRQLPWEMHSSKATIHCQRATSVGADTNAGAESTQPFTCTRAQGTPAFRCRDLDQHLEVLWLLEENVAVAADDGGNSVAVVGPGSGPASGGDTQHTLPTSALPSAWLSASYHCAYLSQRENQFLGCPPEKAVQLPPHVARLIGYCKPGQVLNKLYCGGPPHEILGAYKAYGGKHIDWAGPTSTQEEVERWRSMVPTAIPTTVDLTTFPQHVGVWIQELAKHPNQDGLVTIDSATKNAVELMLAALNRDGCVVLSNAATDEQCEAIMNDLKPYSDDVNGATVGCVLARSAASWPVATQPQLVEVIEALLGKQVLLMSHDELADAHAEHHNSVTIPASSSAASTIHVALTIPKQPGGKAQELHRDGDLSLLDIGRRGYEHAVSTIWALDGDFTEERGATRAVPGSHTWPRAREALPGESVPAVMSRGSVLIYTGRTVHGAGRNSTAAPRIAL
eukprot:gene9399-27967_t